VFKHTGNADGTAVCFDVLQNYTVGAKAANGVKTKTKDYEKLRLTLALCTTADGIKLTHCIVVNRKTEPKYLIVRSQQING
jgi:hypothetical protein